MNKLYAIVVAFLVTLTAAIGAPALGTGLSSVLFTNLNKGYFTVTLTAGTAPTNIVWLNLPQHGAQPDLPGDLLWFLNANLINATDGYIPYRASATNFANSWLYRTVNGTGTDTNLYFGPGTTNTLFRSGRNLVYTNGGTLVSMVISNGAGNWVTLGANSGDVAELTGPAAVKVSWTSGTPKYVQFWEHRIHPLVSGIVLGGDTSVAPMTPFSDLNLDGSYYHYGYLLSNTDYSRLKTSHSGTNGSVIFNSQGAGAAGTGRGFEFQVDGSAVASIAAASGYAGGGTKVLTDDGTYKDVSAVASGVWETSGTVVQPSGAAAGYSVNMDRATVTNLLSTAGVTNATQLDLVGNVAKLRQKSTGFQFMSNEVELVSIDINGNMTLPKIYDTDTRVIPNTTAVWHSDTNLISAVMTNVWTASDSGSNFVSDLSIRGLQWNMTTNLNIVHATNGTGSFAAWGIYSQQLTIINDSGTNFTVSVPATWKLAGLTNNFWLTNGDYCIGSIRHMGATHNMTNVTAAFAYKKQ